jgi:hypothetical protein
MASHALRLSKSRSALGQRHARLCALFVAGPVLLKRLFLEKGRSAASTRHDLPTPLALSTLWPTSVAALQVARRKEAGKASLASPARTWTWSDFCSPRWSGATPWCGRKCPSIRESPMQSRPVPRIVPAVQSTRTANRVIRSLRGGDEDSEGTETVR